MRTVAVLIAASTVLPAAAGAQSSTYFWWHATIEEAETPASATAPTFVLYGEQDSLRIRWIFKNDEGTESLQMPATMRDQIRVSATDREGRAVETTLAWSATGTLAGAEGNISASPFVPLEIQPGEWVEWQASLQRADGSAWPHGQYHLAIDLSAVLKTLRAGAKPLSRLTPSAGILRVLIVPVDSAATAKAKHLLEGHRASAEGRLASAIESYRAAAGIDPGDRAVRGLLGKALVAAGDYQQGAAALELALPLALRGEKSAIPDTLAYAYLALGDESNARRVLLLSGPPAMVASRLEWLRKQLGARHGSGVRRDRVPDP